MKRILFILTLLGWACCLKAQEEKTPLKDIMNIDFAVPDQPAFKALGMEPSDLLRPTDIKSIALQLPNLYVENEFVIPLDFGLEISPWKLFGVQNWNIEQYRASRLRRFAFNSAISAGAFSGDKVLEESNGRINGVISMGFRTTLWGKEGDLLRDPTYASYGYVKHKSKSEIMKEWLTDYNDKNGTDIDESDLGDHDDVVEKFQDFFNNATEGFIPKDNWNATRMDLALAWQAVSPTKRLNDATNASWHLWLTQSIKVGSRGQGLLGAHVDYWQSGYNPELSFNDTSGSNFSLSGRFYLGELGRVPSKGLLHFENSKLFLEYQYKYNWENAVQKDMINLGIELAVSNTLWFTITGGAEGLAVNYPGFSSRFVGSFDIKWGFLSNDDEK